MQEQQKELVKEQLHKNLRDNEMELISLSDNKQKIYWQEDGKEFLFNGELYDVVKSKIINGETILYCLSDNKEKEIIKSYNKVTKNNSSKDKRAKSNVETASTLFVIENKKSEDISSYKFIKEYYLFISQLSVGITNQLLQPPRC
jgi:hypothetical protein